MIRTLRLALLLACCSTTLAQPLYKWIEADGTITFSPEKPEKNIDFQVIDVSKSAKTSENAVIGSSELANSDTDSLGAKDSVGASQAPGITQISYNAAEHELNKDLFKADQVNSLGSNAGKQASLASIMKQKEELSTQTSEFESEIVRKRNDCEDLRKRVVSLERRLKSTLTPDDMDNTIVTMSQYQRSHDKHCAY